MGCHNAIAVIAHYLSLHAKERKTATAYVSFQFFFLTVIPNSLEIFTPSGSALLGNQLDYERLNYVAACENCRLSEGRGEAVHPVSKLSGGGGGGGGRDPF